MAQYNRNITGLDCVRRVCGQMGLRRPQSIVSDPNDHIGQQMLELLNSAGNQLIKPQNGYRWEVLKRQWVLTTVPGTKSYPLPVDWDSILDQTPWSQTSRRIMLGLSWTDPTWNAMTVRTTGPMAFGMIFRFRA